MVKFCFECGAKNNGGRFCAECGTKFTTTDGGASAAPGANGNGNGNGAANAVAAQLNQQMGTTAFTGGAVTAAAPHVANAGFTAAKGAYRNEQMGGAVPMAVPVGGGAAAGSFNYGSSRPSAFAGANNGTHGIPPPPPPPPPPPAPSAFRSSFNGSFNGGNGNNGNANGNAPAFRSSFSNSNKSFNNNSFNGGGGGYEAQAAGQAPAEPVPPAATGAEAQEVYESCVQTIRAARGGNNETGVKAFKQNCKAFGLKQIDVKTFYDSLTAELGPNDTRNFVPHLSRLIPDDMLRKDLIEYNSRQQRVSAFSSGASASGQPAYMGRDSSSSSDSNSSSRRSFNGAAAGGKSKGILKNRYADHPNCDICNVGFDVTKRRHQCRRCGLNVCNSCTPVRLLIPPEMVIENAKKYEPSVPQRVCIQCAPQLHQYQDELVAQYAQSKEQNMHESKGAIHVPFSNSLLKECNNAADIIGNFFRDSWGSSTDRSIPVAFLQKAHGLAIMTIIKAGFLVTGKIGTGLVVAKLPDGSWSAPSAIGTIGLGGGFEIGGEIVEVMIILGSEGAVKVFHKPQVNLGAGLDVTVGPYGRSALAAAAVSTSGLNANYSYSQSKGLYAGISLQGAVIAARSDLNRKFYGRDLPPGEILSGYVEQPSAARPLYEAIDMAMQGVEDHKNEAMRRSSIMGPCRLCNCPMFVAHTHQVWNKSCKTCKHVH